MKTKLYIRVAKAKTGRKKFAVSASPDNQPIFTNAWSRGGYRKVFLPTISFGINLDIPDDMFNQAEKIVAEINLKSEDTKLAVEVEPLGNPLEALIESPPTPHKE